MSVRTEKVYSQVLSQANTTWSLYVYVHNPCLQLHCIFCVTTRFVTRMVFLILLTQYNTMPLLWTGLLLKNCFRSRILPCTLQVGSFYYSIHVMLPQYIDTSRYQNSWYDMTTCHIVCPCPWPENLFPVKDSPLYTAGGQFSLFNTCTCTCSAATIYRYITISKFMIRYDIENSLSIGPRVNKRRVSNYQYLHTNTVYKVMWRAREQFVSEWYLCGSWIGRRWRWST